MLALNLSLPAIPVIPSSSYWAFAVSLCAALGLVLTKRWHGRFSLDRSVGVQKFHTHPTPRVGGIAIVYGVLAAFWVAEPERKAILGPLLFAGLPAFFFGLAEDLTKQVSVLARLLGTMLSGVMGWFITGYAISSVEVPGLDFLLKYQGFSVMFTAFAIGGIANAINIIDGFNGLASGFVIVALLGLAGIALSVNDPGLALTCVAVAASVGGFFVVNWPLGKLFLGDGGSYFGGFAVAWASVLLLERHPQINAFAPLLICIHPVTEVLFSMLRRRWRKSHPALPDRLHLHSLIMRRYVARWLNIDARWQNSITGLMVVLLSLPAVVLGYIFSQSTAAAAVSCLVLILGYISIYARIVRFRWCSPMEFLLVKRGRVLARA